MAEMPCLPQPREKASGRLNYFILYRFHQRERDCDLLLVHHIVTQHTLHWYGFYYHGRLPDECERVCFKTLSDRSIASSEMRSHPL